MRMSADMVMVVVIVLMVLRTPSAQGTITISTTTLTKTQTTTSECPIPPCAVLIGCIPVQGPDGCFTCACPDYNCENLQCGADQECVMEDVGCPPETTPCFPQPKCIPPYETTTACPMIKCAPNCVPGRGADGCPSCVCPRTCEDVNCTKDEECVLQKFVCITDPCFPEPTCVSRNGTTTISTTTLTTTSECPIPPCAVLIGCIPVPGPDGCPICACPDYNCQDLQCGPDQECVMEDVGCPPETTSCFPQPKCIPPYDTSPSSTTTLITADTTTIPATTPTTHIDCIWPMCGPGCSYDRDSNGCLICACSYHICEDWTCDYSGGYCVMQETNCPGVTKQCYFPTCIDRTTIITASPSTTDPTTTITTTIATTTSCQIMYSCPSFCNLYPDTDGCWICGCSSYGCTDSTCGPGEDCVIQKVDCPAVTTPCFSPICIPTTATTTITTPTTTPPCPIVTCGPFCGYTSGPDGCPTCGCPDYLPTCEHFPCGSGETCALEDVECPGVTELCKYPRCITSNDTTDTTTISSTSLTTTFPCPIPLCLEECLPVTGPDGCLRCACPNITCQDVNCTIDEECILQDIVCITEPCFPKPTCVPRNESCTGTPNTKSCGWPGIKNRWFYNSSADACQKFHYYGCTPSPNTFVSRKACEDKCKRTDPPICLDIVCEDDCYTFKRRNQCPQCICPNPCKGFKCSAGEECKLREVTCSEKTCIPQPFCDPILSGAASL